MVPVEPEYPLLGSQMVQPKSPAASIVSAEEEKSPSNSNEKTDSPVAKK